ncbi:MAG: hypothetical protein LH603_20620 [Pseudonocardia sp.]|nr:hypothetical protein [Pseudonocardia sp.]
MFLPVFDPGVDVAPGDRIEGTVTCRPCINGRNPDYQVSGQLMRAGREAVPFRWDADHLPATYKGTPFYQRLFADPPARAASPTSPPFSLGALERYLDDELSGMEYQITLACVPDMLNRSPEPVTASTEVQ